MLRPAARHAGPPIAVALTLDLDDTLWPIAPVIEHCERVLHDYLEAHAPAVAQRFPIPAMRALRDRIFDQHPHLCFDYGTVRRLCLEAAFADAGHHAPALVEQAYALFYAARNQVELYAEVPAALPALAARHRIVALSNGNADLRRIGLADHFHGIVLAREVGCGKPDARIFEHACGLLGVERELVWHVGDDPDLDVIGAHRAGLRAVWLNRDGRDWPHPDGPQPDLIVRDLAELDGWLSERSAA